MENEEEFSEATKLMRKTYLNGEIEKLKRLKNEGRTKEEIWQISNKKIFFRADLEKLFEDEQSEEITQSQKSNEKDEFMYLKNEELVDYENQPFENNDEEDNLELEKSIKENGIIVPLVVRKYQGKYQILSGHRRRMCGSKVGLDVFPCLVCEKNDNEAKIYLVEANLASRKVIKPMERARAYLMRKEALDEENKYIKTVNVREAITEEENISGTNYQRYLRLNFLNKNLQDAVNDKKINIKVAENLSFLESNEQEEVFKFITDRNVKINESQAIKIKNSSKEKRFNIDMLNGVFKEKQNNSEIITIRFLKEELSSVFYDTKDVNNIKNNMLKGIRKLKENGEIDSP